MCFYGCANRDRYCGDSNESITVPMTGNNYIYTKPFAKSKAVQQSKQGKIGVDEYNYLISQINEVIDRNSKNGETTGYFNFACSDKNKDIKDKIINTFKQANYKITLVENSFPNRCEIKIDWSE